MNSGDELQHALALTLEMTEAAAQGNWQLVAELDERRQAHLQALRDVPLDPRHHEALAQLQAHNRALLERAGQVRAGVEQELSQHRYNHKALQTYMTSAG